MRDAGRSPPGISSPLPLQELVRVLEQHGAIILGVQARAEGESDMGDPSVLRGGPS